MSAPPPYTQQPYPQGYGYPQPQQNCGYPQPQSGYPQAQPQGYPQPQSHGYPQPQQQGYPQPQPQSYLQPQPQGFPQQQPQSYSQPQPQGYPQPPPLSGNPQEQLQVVVVERVNSSSNKKCSDCLAGCGDCLVGCGDCLAKCGNCLAECRDCSDDYSNNSTNWCVKKCCLYPLLACFCLALLWKATSSTYKLSSPYEQTQALGAKAAATLNSTATESLAKIFSAASGQSENYYIVSYATSKIEAVKKDGLAAIDSAVATAKAAFEAAGADRTAAGANMEIDVKANAVTAIDAALSAAVIAINAVTDSAIAAIHPIDLWSNNSTAYTIANKSVVIFMFVLLISTKIFS